MRSQVLLGALVALVLACDSSGAAASQGSAGGERISIDQLCNHFVDISAKEAGLTQGDQIAKRDRSQDFAECMANFPGMESQLVGDEKTNFRPCAAKAKTVQEFTACAPTLFKPPAPSPMPAIAPDPGPPPVG